jgi:hypothetical protein
MNSITGKALVWNHVLNFSGEDGLGLVQDLGVAAHCNLVDDRNSRINIRSYSSTTLAVQNPQSSLCMMVIEPYVKWIEVSQHAFLKYKNQTSDGVNCK